MHVSVPDNVLWRCLSGLCILTLRKPAGYYLLEDTAAEIWQAIAKGQQPDDIVASLCGRYDASPDTVRRDVNDLTEALGEQGLLAVQPECSKGSVEGAGHARQSGAILERESAEIMGIMTKMLVPLQGFLELTRRCNEKCVHCYLQDDPGDIGEGDELTLQRLKTLIAEMASAGCMELSISGGEPGIRADFDQVVYTAASHGIKVNLYTNGTAFSKQQVRDMAPLLSEVKVSLYGSDWRSHEAVTGVPGSFAATMRFLEWAKEASLEATIQFIAMRDNCSELEAVFRLANAVGFRWHVGAVIEPTLRGSLLPLKVRMSDAQALKFCQDAKRGAYGPEMAAGCRPDDKQETTLAIPCAAGFRMFSIRPDGVVYPCVRLPQEVGNVLTDSFETTWSKSPKMLDYRRQIRQGIPRWECPRCQLWRQCPLYCPGAALIETGDLWKAPASRCWLAGILKETW